MARPTSPSPSSTTSAWCRRPTCRRTTRALLKLLQTKADAYKGKVTAYDPEKSGVGYLFVNEDAKNFPQAFDLFRAFGKVNIKLYTSAGAMIERVTSGEHTIAYGIFGSYALGRSKKVPNLGIVMPKDYTLVASRVAFISAKAKNPNAAKLFLDYLLSKRAQTIIANQAELYSLRDDVQRRGDGEEGRGTGRRQGAADSDRAGAAGQSRRGQAARVSEAVASRDEGAVSDMEFGCTRSVVPAKAWDLYGAASKTMCEARDQDS